MRPKKMKWFFALNQNSDRLSIYSQLAQVAVLSALRNTQLEPHFIFDGEKDHPLVNWMESHSVTVHHKRTRFYDQLTDLSIHKGNHALQSGAGAFLRLEVPDLVRECGYPDQYVLYTDCDVMFTGDIKGLYDVHPKIFAVFPEGFHASIGNMNSGVMVMNIPSLMTTSEALTAFTRRHLELFVSKKFSWDQSALRNFYRPLSRFLLDRGMPHEFWEKRGVPRVLTVIDKPLWELLPITYNWATYYDNFESYHPQVVHFHGPKPNDIEGWKRFASSTDVASMLLSMLNENFEHWSSLWWKYLKDDREAMNSLD